MTPKMPPRFSFNNGLTSSVNAPFSVNCEFIFFYHGTFLVWIVACLNLCWVGMSIFNISLGTSIKVFFKLDIRYEYEHSNSLEMDIRRVYTPSTYPSKSYHTNIGLNLSQWGRACFFHTSHCFLQFSILSG
jgi:hypothetical protein